MSTTSLESLLLTEDELDEAKAQVEEAAYFKWLDAGCPQGVADEIWQEAELEWIEYCYVPDRLPAAINA